MTTIRDVAKLAGVSTATVSHVINNTRIVLPDTKGAVLAAVKQLNYRPNSIARSLTTAKTHTIGVLVSDITSSVYVQLARGIEECLAPHHYHMLVCNTDNNPEREAFTALITTHSIAALRILRELGLSYPEAVSLILIGDAPWMQIAKPVSLIELPCMALCQQAVQLCMAGIAATQAHCRNHAHTHGSKLAEFNDVVIAAQLIERGSCRAIYV